VERDPFEYHRAASRRMGAVRWWAIAAVAVVAGAAVWLIWSVDAGVLLAIVIVLLGVEAQNRLSKRWWIGRYPELADPLTEWRGAAPKPNDATRTPALAAVEKAKMRPNGWVYEIIGSPAPGETIPPERIRGAWKVDAAGKITRFVPYPELRRHEPRSSDGSPLG
jgi:hypothetical protein